MILRIDHCSIALKEKNFERAVEFFTKILGAIPQTHGKDNLLKYYWEIFTLGDLTRLEIIKPTEQGSFLENFLRKKEGGVHHLTLQCPDIEKAGKFLEDNKIPYFGKKSLGASWKELYIHPKHAFGVLLQIAEFKPDDWIAPSSKMPEGQKWSITKINSKYQLTFAHPGGSKVNLNLDKEELKKLIYDLEKLVKIN